MFQQNKNKRKQNYDIIKEQRNALKDIFGNSQEASALNQNNIWKILIFDNSSRLLVSSLCKMKDLRENNITLYLSLKQQREQLHGITAIYMIEPVMQNIDIIVNDFERQLYSKVIVHFVSEPSVHVLSSLAKILAKKKPSALSKIEKVEYSTIGYYAIDNKMAILPKAAEFFNFLLNLKHPPIFLYGPKEEELVFHLKEKFDSQKIRKKLDDSGHTLVLLFNRQLDFFPVLSHGISYGALLQNFYTISANGNRITSSVNKSVSYDLDLTDQIWLEKKNLMISDMQLQKELNKVKARMISLTNKVDQYTEMNQKSKKLEWHIGIAQQLIKEAKRRRLNQYYDLENQIYVKRMIGKQNLKRIMDLLHSQDIKNSHEDKVRMMLIYIIFSENLDQCEELQNAFPDIKKEGFYNELKMKRMKGAESGSNSLASGKYLKKLAKGIWKNLMTGQKKFMVTKYLAKVRDLHLNEINELGLSVATAGKHVNNEDLHKVKIDRTVVYCQGGVCLNQEANINQYDDSVYYTGDRFVNFKNFRDGNEEKKSPE